MSKRPTSETDRWIAAKIICWIAAFAWAVWIFSTPIRHKAHYKALVQSYISPIKVIDVIGKKYQIMVAFEDKNGKRGTGEPSDDDVIVKGDEIELDLTFFNYIVARRKHHAD